MKVLTSRVVVSAIMSVVAIGFVTVACADTPAVDYKTVASKAYVDEEIATKQNKLSVGTYGANNSVVTYDSTVGGVQERWILGTNTINPAVITNYVRDNNLTTLATSVYLADYTRPSLDTIKQSIVSTEVLGNVMATKQNKIAAGTAGQVVTYSGTAGTFGTPLGILDKRNVGTPVPNYSITFDDRPENWAADDATKLVNSQAFAVGLALKQNKIDATSNGTDGTPNYVYNVTTNPTAAGSVVTTSTTAGVTGQVGIATAPTRDNQGNLTNGDWLPTMSALMNQIGSATATLTWDSEKHPNVINKYKTAFGTGADDWPDGTGDDLVTGSFLANALALKQNILPSSFISVSGTTNLRPQGGNTIEVFNGGYALIRYITAGGNTGLTYKRNADNVILYVNGTKTLSEFQTSNFGATDSDTITKNEKYIKGALVSLELLKDVYAELDTKIINALPTGTTGTVVTYNGTDANGMQQFGEVTIAHNLTYTTDANPTVSNLDDIASVELVVNTLAGDYQPIIHPSGTSGVTQIVARPAYNGTAGEIQSLALDTSSLYTIDDTHIPSSKLVDSQISNLSGHKVNGAPISKAASYFYGEGVGAAATETKTVSISSITGTPAVGQVIIVKPATTNTSSTIKINLNGTTAYSVLYRGSTSNIPSEVWTAYTPSIFVLDETSGGTKYWRYVGTSPVAMNWSSTETTATNAYSTTFDGEANNWPVADANKYVKGDSFATGLALKQNILPAIPTDYDAPLGGQTIALTDNAGVPAVRYITKGFNDALTVMGNTNSYSVGSLLLDDNATAFRLFAAKSFLAGPTNAAIQKAKDTLVSLELLKDVYDRVKRPTGTTGTVVTYNGTDTNGTQQFGETAIDTIVTSNSTNLITSGAVYTADLARQNLIPAAGSVRSANNSVENSPIRDWTVTDIKGDALVSKTSTDGVVGERKIFEPDATYTNNAETNIQIATIGAVKANTLQKVCAGYKPGTTVANRNADNCWLWTVQTVAVSDAVCTNPSTCGDNSPCCDGYSCSGNGVCAADAAIGGNDRI